MTQIKKFTLSSHLVHRGDLKSATKAKLKRGGLGCYINYINIYFKIFEEVDVAVVGGSFFMQNLDLEDEHTDR